MEKFLKLLKFTIEVVLVILFIIFEEIVWKKLALPLKDKISELKVAEKIKAKIIIQSTYMTLLIFLLPLALAELMGIYSGIWIVSGAVSAGIFLYILKIPVAAITFWIFSFTKEKLVTIDWFKTLYDLLVRFLDFIKSTEIYKRVKLKIISIKEHAKRLMPGSGHFSEEMTFIYESLKKLFNGLSNKIKDMKNEAKEINGEKSEKIVDETTEKEEDNIVDRIAEENKDKVIKPEESRRDAPDEDKEIEIPKNESRGYADR